MFGPHLPTAMGLPHACTHTLSGCVEWGCAHTPRARCAHSVGRKPIVELWERCGLTLTHRALRTSHACRACSGVPVWVWRCQEMRGGCPALAPPPRVSGVVPPQGPHLASPCLRARSAAWLAMLDADSRPASPHISPYLEALDAVTGPVSSDSHSRGQPFRRTPLCSAVFSRTRLDSAGLQLCLAAFVALAHSRSSQSTA